VGGVAIVMAFSNHKNQQQRSKRTTSVPVHNRAFERIGSLATCRSGSGQMFPVLKQQHNPHSSVFRKGGCTSNTSAKVLAFECTPPSVGKQCTRLLKMNNAN
jgi:hypothetical protein